MDWRYALASIVVTLLFVGLIRSSPAECIEWAEVTTNYTNQSCLNGGFITTEPVPAVAGILVRCHCKKPDVKLPDAGSP